MIKLNINKDKLKALDSLVVSVLAKYPSVILAGGAIRDSLQDRDIADYDLFFTDLTQVGIIKQSFIDEGFKVVFACPQGLLFTLKKDDVKVQLISKRSYGGVYDLFHSFDFTICQFAILNGDISTLYTTKEAIRDNRKNMLTLNNLEYPTATVNRLGKYKEKGFYTGGAAKEIVGWLVDTDRSEYNPDDDALYID